MPEIVRKLVLPEGSCAARSPLGAIRQTSYHINACGIIPDAQQSHDSQLLRGERSARGRSSQITPRSRMKQHSAFWKAGSRGAGHYASTIWRVQPRGRQSMASCTDDFGAQRTNPSAYRTGLEASPAGTGAVELHVLPVSPISSLLPSSAP